MPRLPSLALACLLTAPAAAQTAPDTAALRKTLRQTASDYEQTVRSQAPHRLSQNLNCDENVGRYCVVYDAGTGAVLPPEPERVKQVRARVIDAYRKGVDTWPTDSLLVGPLIRYLIEDGRAADAVGVAQTYLQQADDRGWASLLLGWAQHSSGDDAAADLTFARTLPGLLPSERIALHDVTPLLSKEEKEKYGALSGAERARYHERLWRLADPLYLTEGNESLIEHFSRQIYGRILSYAPDEAGGWGPDLAELTTRFGVASARSQNFGTGVGGRRLTEHYDPNQLTFVPPAMMTKGGLVPFEPGGIWPYDTIRSRSGYAPRTFRRMVVLEHQVARFPAAAGGELRADYVLTTDSTVKRPARIQVGLFALDSSYAVVGQAIDTVSMSDAAVARRLTMPLPRGTVAYSLEAMELETRYAARARYGLPPLRTARPILSDVVILSAGEAPPPSSRESPDFTPLATLVIPQGNSIALYMEARGLVADAGRQVRYRIDLEVLEQERPGTFTRVVRRLGRSLGLGGDDIAPKITWDQQQAAAEATLIALKLGQVQLDPGLKLFRITLTDMQTNGTSTAERLVRVNRER